MTIIAAYAEPWLVLSVMMIPALDHGWTPGCRPASGPPGLAGPAPPPYRPVSAVIRTVMLPLPVSGWRTK